MRLGPSTELAVDDIDRSDLMPSTVRSPADCSTLGPRPLPDRSPNWSSRLQSIPARLTFRIERVPARGTRRRFRRAAALMRTCARPANDVAMTLIRLPAARKISPARHCRRPRGGGRSIMSSMMSFDQADKIGRPSYVPQPRCRGGSIALHPPVPPAALPVRCVSIARA